MLRAMSLNVTSSDLSAQARAVDRDRWLCALFVPPEARDAAMALILFNDELARIPELVSQPVAGMIRYQWWRESVEGAAEGRPRAHPVVEGLSRPLRTGRLSRHALLEMIDVRERDLENLAPEDPAALEAYAAATAGGIQACTAALLGADDAAIAAARDVGTAYGLIGIVRATASMARQGRTLLPASLTTEIGIEPADLLGTEATEAVRSITRRITERALALLDRPRPSSARPATAAMLPGALARDYARRIAAVDYDPAAAATLRHSPLMPLRLWWAYRRGSG